MSADALSDRRRALSPANGGKVFGIAASTWIGMPYYTATVAPFSCLNSCMCTASVAVCGLPSWYVCPYAAR